MHTPGFVAGFRRAHFPSSSLQPVLPGMHFFPASALVCVSVFLLACFLGPGSGPLLSLLLGPVRQGVGWGCVGFQAAARCGCYITYLRLSLYPCLRLYRCVLHCVARNIPVSALVFACVRMLFTLLVIPWCVLCNASSCVDGLQREGGGWFSWRLLGQRVRWRCGVVHFVLLACPWPSHPRGVHGGGFGLVLPPHTLLVHASVCGHTTCFFCALGLVVCVFVGSGVPWAGVWLPALGFVGVGALHTITAFRMGCPLGIPSYQSCSVPRCWRPLVLREFFDGVHMFFGVGGFLPH